MTLPFSRGYKELSRQLRAEEAECVDEWGRGTRARRFEAITTAIAVVVILFRASSRVVRYIGPLIIG